MKDIKRFLCKCSICIPIFVIYVILLDFPGLSITEIDLYLSPIYVLFLYITITVLWLCCSPFRSSCCHGGWTEVLFNLVPVEIMSLLVFSQWHFATAIILLIVMPLLQGGMTWLMRRDERQYSFSVKRRRRYNRGLQRFAVLLSAVVCAAPCFMAIIVYELKSPIYQAEQELLDTVFESGNKEEDTSKTDQYEENRQLLLYFEEATWNGLDVQEKITAAQSLADFEAAQLGIPSIPVLTQKLDANTYGSYSDEEREIFIDIEHLAHSPVDECLQTICHEMYHAAQLYIIDKIDWEMEVFQSSYFQELRQWRDNRENYKDPDINGFDAYESQPLEEAARAYADEETERIFSYINN